MSESKATIQYDASAHKVHAVTVYQTNRAEIKRRICINLQQGQNEVEIENLPTSLEENSLRVDGVGRNATIFDVIYHSRDAPDTKAQDKLMAPLTKRYDALKAQRDNLDRQSRILKDYSKTLNGTNINTENLVGFLDLFGSKQEAIEEKLVAVDEQLEEVNSEIRTMRDKLGEEMQIERMRRACVSIVLFAEEAGEVELSLTYMVPNASWTPLYDIRAAIAENSKTDSSVNLQYRASIYQGTGEDWKDVALVLSTASPQQDGTTIPSLDPEWIGERKASMMLGARKSMRRSRGGLSMATMVVPPGGPPMPPPPPAFMVPSPTVEMDSRRERSSSPLASRSPSPRAMRVRTADLSTPVVVQEASFPPPEFLSTRDAFASGGSGSTSFTIPGLSTIPSATAKKTQTHKVSIADIECGSVDLSWITVPRDTANAYLQCKVQNTTPFLLLPGQASVFMNNSFVAKSFIPRVSPQESFTCSLGVDSAVRITYHPLNRKERTSGGSIMLMSSKTNVWFYQQIITVKNTRLTPLTPLIVKDRIPVSRDAKVKVSLLEPKGLQAREKGAAAKEVPVSAGITARWSKRNEDDSSEGEVEADSDASFGRMEWTCEVAAGASVDLTLSWEISAPVGVMVEMN